MSTLIVGNDIVDLGDPEAHHGADGSVAPELARGLGGCHPRFDARVFAPSELATLAVSESKRLMRWVLWSAKEAAYKAARQERAEVAFSPVRFIVHMHPTLRGFVSYEDRRWPVRVAHRGNCIHALVVNDDEDGSTIWESRRLTATELDDPSRSVREFAVATIARRLNVSASDLRIESSGRVPQLLLANGGKPQTLSLSHHGIYVGFAYRAGPEQDLFH
jgi:phosphopantetheinyl transferase (holo-ACP synthase)